MPHNPMPSIFRGATVACGALAALLAGLAAPAPAQPVIQPAPHRHRLLPGFERNWLC
jgi:hypothetical protein